MDQSYLERIAAWNRNMNDIPRRFAIVLLVILCCGVAVVLFPYFWPFVLAMGFAAMLEPVARLLRRAFKKLKAARILATLVCMVLLFGLLTVGITALADRVIREGVNLLKAMPDLASKVISRISEWVGGLYAEYGEMLPADFMETISSILNNMLSSVVSTAANISTKVAGFTISTTISTATSLPIIILSVIFIIMGTFYFSYDRERIFRFFRRTFPRSVIKNYMLISNGVFVAIFGQIRAQIFISCVLTLIILAGLLILGKPYALLLSLLIGLADVLPVVGAGLILNSWAIISLILGDVSSGIGLFVIYLCTITTRQIIEPRIVGKQLGLYPLVTMASMFAGFQLMGALGLIAGPLVANICRVALDADAGRLGGPKQPTQFSVYIASLKEKLFAKRKK